MADWSWKQAVASCVLEIVNRKRSPEFDLDELWAFAAVLSRQFPRNRNVRPKVRQILQRLRDHEGFVTFLGGARYRLNLSYEELSGEVDDLATVGVESLATRRALRTIRLRSTFLAAEIKRRYEHICQVCRIPLVLAEGRYYAEGHHLKPLGAPHNGPDIVGNVIVLCPNHHVLFDRAVLSIVPDSLRICHRVPGVFREDARLYLQPWHRLNPRMLDYHHRRYLDACRAHAQVGQPQ